MSGIIFSQGSGVNDSVFGKSQEPIKMMLEKRGEAFEAQSALPSIFTIEKSNRYAEKLTTMTAMDNFLAVGENGAYPMTGFQEGFSKTIEHMTWKNSFALSKEIMDDATTIDLRKRPEAFIATYYRTREAFGANLFNAALAGNTTFSMGGKTFDASCADSTALFSASHDSKTKGSKVRQRNVFNDLITANGADVASMLAALETKMQNFKGDNGELLDIAPDTILIPNDYAIKKLIFEAIGADKDPATDHNGFNYQFGRWNVVVWSYLGGYHADSKPVVMLDSKYNQTYIGAALLDREPLSVDSDIDKNTDANVWRGRARFGAGFNDWRFAAAIGINGAGASVL